MSEKYLVICNAHPKEYDDYYIKLSGCDTTSSSAIYSNSVIRGLSLNNFDFDVISAASVGHYPFTSKTKKLKQIKYGNHFFGVGYNNNILISQLSKTKSIVKKYREISNDGSQGVLNIIVTDVHYPFLKAALKIRKKNKKTKIVLVCLDLPQYVKSSSKNPLLKFLKKISVNRVNKLSKKVDGYVFLSKYMEEIYGSKKRNIVSPCILDTSIYDGIQKASKETIDFVYCGVLSKQYNADFLLKAFSMLNSDNYRLILAGKGDVVEQINEMSKNDKRINYLGEVSREKAYFLQKNADVLVNPRLPNSEYTKLSFPSKTVSYLYSGNPLVCYSLPSFPDGLKNVIIEPKDIAPESFAEAMEFAIDKTNSKQIEETLKFSEKNVVKQIDKLFSEIRKNG